MARGSGYGGGDKTVANTSIEMAGGGGGFQSTGKITLNKKYFVTDATQLNTAPIISGYLATQINFTRLNDTAFEQNVTYEAQQENGNSDTGGVVWLENGLRGTFEMFCSYETRPIENHPRLTKLFEKFGGFLNGDVAVFNLLLSAGSTALSSGKATRSPMFGVRNYKEITMILRHTYMVKNIAGSIWNTMGKVTTTLPAGIPPLRGKRMRTTKRSHENG